MSYQPGDVVVFNCPFENADARMERGNIGVVRSPGPLFVSVVAKRMIWLAKTNEIRKATISELSIQVEQDALTGSHYALIHRYTNLVHETGLTDSPERAVEVAKDWIAKRSL